MSAVSNLRPDLAAIAEMIPDGARVLDVGCGDGALLEYLVRTKKVDGRGIELSQQNVNACVARGLAVVQGDSVTGEMRPDAWGPNLLAQGAIFLLRKS